MRFKIFSNFKILSALAIVPVVILPLAFAASTKAQVSQNVAKTALITNLISVKLENVIDGDTIAARPENALNGQTSIRYRIHGIDTPEPRNAQNNFAENTGLQKLYADKASQYAKSFLQNKNLTVLTADQDKYGRSVVRLFANDIDFSLEMVKVGLARVFYISATPGNNYYSPDTDFVTALYVAQWNAYKAGLGIWENQDDFTTIYPN